MSDLPPTDYTPWLFTGGAGVLGRAVYHAVQVQQGKRKSLSWVVVWDIPIAVCMGWIGLGAAVWFKLPWESTVSFAMVASYLGPYGIDTLFAKWAEKHFKAKGGEDGESGTE